MTQSVKAAPEDVENWQRVVGDLKAGTFHAFDSERIIKAMDFAINAARPHEADQGKALATYKRNQPCGCIVCFCADEERCHGCGARSCGKGEACVFKGARSRIEYENHVVVPLSALQPPAYERIEGLDEAIENCIPFSDPKNPTGHMVSGPRSSDLKILIEAARQHASAAIPEGQWQPIETAPKNEEILLGHYNSNWPEHFYIQGRGKWIGADIEEFFVFNPDGHLKAPSDNPTHWMKLPEPPVIEAVIPEGEK